MTFSRSVRFCLISLNLTAARLLTSVKICELVKYSSKSARSWSLAFKNAPTSDCANNTARVNCSKLRPISCSTIGVASEIF